MAEAGLTDDVLARALRDAGRGLSFPPAPSVGPAVAARLEADRAARSRPPFPGVALWSRRRVLVLVAVGLLALLALAFGARFVLGAAEVRVRPGATPTGPPLEPSELGEPATLEELGAAAGFPIALPSGAPPDAAYAIRTESGEGALLAWDAGGPFPTIPGTSWGLLLLQVADDEEVVLKDVNRFEDLREVEVDGRPAAWIDAPHQLIVAIADGARAFSVPGTVLIWTDGEVTFRLESALPLHRAIALAESIG
jgi:hypothetical protein